MRRLKADEIECRIAQNTEKGSSLLLYKTARVDRAILDELYGDLWQNDFKVIDGKMYGGIGIYNKELKEWLWRWDCGVESNTEAEKGQASDAFKRAGFKWGIGVELYTAPFIWIQGGTEKDEFSTKKAGKNVYKRVNRFEKFSVKEINYAENGDINRLVIVNDKGEKVYVMGAKLPEKEPEKKDDTHIYIQLSKIDDPEEITAFYNQYKTEVNDRKAFWEMANSRREAIKEINKKFEGEECKTIKTTPMSLGI